MFEPSNDDKKLDWMYKGAGSSVDREDYLLGRSVDKGLEQLNASEKQIADVKHPKNHVEHECIPPSIRDFQNLSSGEQVDLAQKLQEDPLVAIKKQEEETRRRLLQNPVQLKKLQNVLKFKTSKKKTKKNKKKCKKSKSDSEDIDARLAEKYLKLKVHLSDSGNTKNKKSDKNDLDKILAKKLKILKDKISKNDLDAIINMDSSSTGSSDSEEEKSSKRQKNKAKKRSSSSSDFEKKRDKKNSRSRRSLSKTKKLKHAETETKILKLNQSYRKRNDSSSSSDNSDEQHVKKSDSRDKKSRIDKMKEDFEHKKQSRTEDKKTKSKYVSNTTKDSYKNSNKAHQKRRSVSSSPVRKNENHVTSSSEEESVTEENKQKKINYGLVKADGSKIPLSKKSAEKNAAKPASTDKTKNDKKVDRYKRKKLSEEEIENRRKEMLKNAEWRDNERVSNVKRYREDDKTERKHQDYNPNFLQDQLVKSASSSTVESRIKSSINHIQRSKKDMNSHFSRRY